MQSWELLGLGEPAQLTTQKQAPRVVELMGLGIRFKLKGPLEMVQSMGQYCPPRSMYCIHEEAVLCLLSFLLDGVQRVNPHELPGPTAPAISWG